MTVFALFCKSNAKTLNNASQQGSGNMIENKCFEYVLLQGYLRLIIMSYSLVSLVWL